ncbi:hypothetical protein RB200_05095 [Streptomyces sp. PmtG]
MNGPYDDATGTGRGAGAAPRPDEPAAPPSHPEHSQTRHALTPTVRALLDAARLPADEHQLAGLVTAYAAQRPAVDALFDVAGTRHALPVPRRGTVAVGPDDDGEPAPT